METRPRHASRPTLIVKGASIRDQDVLDFTLPSLSVGLGSWKADQYTR